MCMHAVHMCMYRYVESDRMMDEKDAFRVYDSDGSGGISPEELSRVSEGLGAVRLPAPRCWR